ncbi:lysine transporter LysE [Pasteurellaceae bacterium Macca]|nr:lysine transporter LysE [Pasteurellaceae bacterium Macca]
MYGIENYWGFVIASILLNLTPGSDTLYILTRTIGEGGKSGIMSSLGILVGTMIHILAVSLGLSQIIVHSPILFDAIKYAGAIYLLYLGIKAWRKPLVIKENPLENLPLAKIFIQGMVTNLLNPKVVLFFLALLPQFIAVNSENTFLPFILLGLTVLATSLIYCMLLVTFASRIGNLLRSSDRIATNLNRLCGSVFISLGIKIALQK